MPNSVQPVTFYVPVSAGEPVEVKVAHSGLRMVLVNRESVGLLDDFWKVLGVYFLLGPAADPEHFKAYVGEVGRRDLVLRLKEHAVARGWWNRALLIASAGDGFNSAEIGWLEGRLYDVLNNAVAAEVMNKGRPGDNSIDPKDRGVLERYVEPIIAALRACGAPPDTVDQKPAPTGKKRAYYRESVKDLIDGGLLKVGTQLLPLRKHLTTPALVLEDGSLQVEGVVHGAVSPAAQAVSGNKSEPGWEFWGAPSGAGGYVSLFALRDRLRADKNGQTTAVAAPTADSPSSAAASESATPAPAPAPAPASDESTGHRKRHFKQTVKDLLDAGLLAPGETIRSVRSEHSGTATVLGDGRVQLGDQTYAKLSPAAKAVSGNTSEPGWEFWAVERDGKLVPLYNLRSQLQARQEDAARAALDLDALVAALAEHLGGDVQELGEDVLADSNEAFAGAMRVLIGGQERERVAVSFTRGGVVVGPWRLRWLSQTPVDSFDPSATFLWSGLPSDPVLASATIAPALAAARALRAASYRPCSVCEQEFGPEHLEDDRPEGPICHGCLADQGAVF